MSAKRIMRAVRVSQFGGPEVLKVDSNVPVPTPSASQVLIEVKAAGINPVDTYIRSGTFGINIPLPYTPGSDVAGTVKDIGSKVTKFKRGDKVFALQVTGGGYAEYTIAEEKMVGHLVGSLTHQQGAAIGIPYYTAYRALYINGKAKFQPGNSVLIHGASGAVGLACVQIAASRGIKVFGTAGTKEGLDFVRKQGASAVFNHRESGYTDKILKATDGKGPDLIIEMLANVNLEADLALVNRGGIIVVVGSRGPVEINPGHTMQKECIITGMSLMNTTQEEWTQLHAGIAEGLKKGWLVPHIGKEYKLEEAPAAHDEIINNEGTLGKRVFVL